MQKVAILSLVFVISVCTTGYGDNPAKPVDVRFHMETLVRLVWIWSGRHRV